ncbi:MAG TPA: hypothetical protein VJA21_28555 [Verrucomicrobiae bacterium]
MKQFSVNNNTNGRQKNGRRRSGYALPGVLLAIAVMSVAVARGETWSFKLVGAPTALNKNSPRFESIRMMGTGTFDPVLGVVSASGTYTLYNAFDHPNGPVIYATWHSTDFVRFTPERGNKGTLTFKIGSSDALAGTGELTVMEDGIEGPIIANEPYIVPPGGSGGGARFHHEENEPFFPPLPPAVVGGEGADQDN